MASAQKKSWADEVEEEEDQTRQHDHDHPRTGPPPPPPPRSSPPGEADSWRRRAPAPAPPPPPPHHKGSPPQHTPSHFQPKAILTHSAPNLPHRHSAGSSSYDPTHHHAAQHDGMRSGAAGAHSVPNSQGAHSSLPPGLQEAVTAACQDIVQPYCKAMVQLLHQLMMAIPTQLPKAVAAAYASHSPSTAAGSGAAPTINTAELQKSLLISLAPIQEQVAQIQKTLAHVVAVSPNTPPAASSPAVHSPAVAAVQSHRPDIRSGRASGPPSRCSTPPPQPAPGSSTPNTGTPVGGLTFAERAMAAAAARRSQTNSETGAVADPAAAEGAADDDTANKHKQHRIKSGHQAYQPPTRRTE